MDPDSVAPQWSALKNASTGSYFGKLGTGQTSKHFEKALAFKEKFYLCHLGRTLGFMYYHFQMMHQIMVELKILVLKDDQCSYTWLKCTDT